MQVLSTVISFIADQNIDAYFVGGLVRDELLGRAVKRDIDVAVAGSAIDLARAFANAYGGAFYLMDEEHDVARVILRETYVDFAGLRGDLKQDLATRDFTINAMARHMGRTELIDPFHGEAHLRDKIICAVSDEVFNNDPVRLLRALRFAGELGFDLDAHTRELIQRDAKLLAFASMERARDELCKILALPNPTKWLRRADSLGLLVALIPEIGALKTTTQSAPHVFNVFDHTMRVLDELESVQAKKYAEVAGGDFAPELQTHFNRNVASDHSRPVVLRLAALLHDIGKPLTRSVDSKGKVHFYRHEDRGAEMAEKILRQLRFSNDEVELVTKIILYHLRSSLLADEPKVTNRAAYKFFRDAGEAGIDVCTLSIADRRGTYAAGTVDKNDVRLVATQKILLEKYFRAPQMVVAPPILVDGHALMEELNLPAGPQIGKLLEAIREEQADGAVTTREQAIAFARKSLTTENTEGAEKRVGTRKVRKVRTVAKRVSARVRGKTGKVAKKVSAKKPNTRKPRKVVKAVERKSKIVNQKSRTSKDVT